MTFIYSPPSSDTQKYALYKPQGTANFCRIGGASSDLNAYDMIRWKSNTNNYWNTTHTSTGFDATEIIAMPNGNWSHVFLKPNRKVLIEYNLVLPLYETQTSDFHQIRLTLVPNHNSSTTVDKINDINYGEVSFDTIWSTRYTAGLNTFYETKALHAVIENTKSSSMAFAFTLRDNSSLNRSGGDSTFNTLSYLSDKSYLKVIQLD